MESQHDDMDLRIRMNLVKCERFKTLQTDLPKKKYPFCEYESDSLHELRLMGEGSDLDKWTDTTTRPEMEEILEEPEVLEPEAVQEEEEAAEEIKEEEEVKKEDVKKEVKPPDEVGVKALTGFFRDKIRRIDYMLVLDNDSTPGTDRMKLDYVTNILRTGLEIEIEKGMMGVHNNLSFIKLHAPDSVLNEYSNLFAVKRYFVNNRVQFMGTQSIFNMILSIFRFRYWKDQEKEWVKIMRSNYTPPNGYSNYERSLVVYKILRHLPFGDYIDQYGIHRLLRRNVIVAAYALHDGPYFAIPKQTALGANGRQFLFYYWTGLQNIFHSQPLHLIHEYFGPKIAFYYAFYEFYNVALALASVAGILTLLMRYVDRTEPDVMKTLVCADLAYDMCPECEMRPTNGSHGYGRCFMRPQSDYCDSTEVNVHLDHPYTPVYSIFMMLWAISFISIWRKKEFVLNWTWEVDGRDSYYKTSTRPEYDLDYFHPRRSAKTGMRYNETGYYKAARIILSVLLPFVLCMASLYIMDECKHFYDNFSDTLITKKKHPKTRDYLTLAIFQAFYTLFISVLEMLYYRLCYCMVNFENHKSLETYEKSLVKKQFEFSITFMYSFMCYYGWTVGKQLLYRGRCQWQHFYPHRSLLLYVKQYIRIPWYIGLPTYSRECMRYCWPFTCIIELSILLAVMLVIKQVIFRIVFSIQRMTTDYNEIVGSKIPVWEREYKLKEFTEATLTSYYMVLAIQFSLVTFFVTAFPLAPLVVLVVNIWDMRQSARRLLLASRRAILIRSPGIGAWYNVFVFIAYTAIATNVLTLVYTTKWSLRIHFELTSLTPNNTILDRIVFDPIVFVPYSETHLQRCMMPILRRSISEMPVSYTRFFLLGTSPLPDYQTVGLHYYTLMIAELKLLLVCVVGVFVAALFIHFYLFTPYRRDIDKTKALETKIKNLFAHYSFIEHNK